MSLPSTGQAEEASIYDYWLGDHIIDYALGELDVVEHNAPSEGQETSITVRAPNNTEVSLAFSGDSLILQYMQHEWLDRDNPAPTAIALPDQPEFVFGTTRASDIQAAFGGTGFHYQCLQHMAFTGGAVSFISYRIPSQPKSVYTFVVEHSRDLAERGLIDFEKDDFTQAVLVGSIVSHAQYMKDAFCEERTSYTSTPDVISTSEPEKFTDFLPSSARAADTGPWEVVTYPELMITKHSAVAWDDRIVITPADDDCTSAVIKVWASTFEDRESFEQDAHNIEGAFNLLLSGQQRVPLGPPIKLDRAAYLSNDAGSALPAALGLFIIGTFDFERIMSTEWNPSMFGFSFEFSSESAGMSDNYWSHEGLFEAGEEIMRICEHRRR